MSLSDYPELSAAVDHYDLVGKEELRLGPDPLEDLRWASNLIEEVDMHVGHLPLERAVFEACGLSEQVDAVVEAMKELALAVTDRFTEAGHRGRSPFIGRDDK